MTDDRTHRLEWVEAGDCIRIAKAGELTISVVDLGDKIVLACEVIGMHELHSSTLELAKIEAEHWLIQRCRPYINIARDLGLLEEQPSTEEVLATIGTNAEEVAKLAAVRKKLMDAWPKPKEDR